MKLTKKQKQLQKDLLTLLFSEKERLEQALVRNRTTLMKTLKPNDVSPETNYTAVEQLYKTMNLRHELQAVCREITDAERYEELPILTSLANGILEVK